MKCARYGQVACHHPHLRRPALRESLHVFGYVWANADALWLAGCHDGALGFEML